MQVSEIINRTLKLISVLEEGGTPSSEQQTDALNALNDMLNEWQDKGISVGLGDLALTDDFPVDESDLRAVRYNLAVEIAPEYERDPSMTVLGLADKTYQRLRAKYTSVKEVEFDTSLQSWSGYDRNTGPEYFTRS